MQLLDNIFIINNLTNGDRDICAAGTLNGAHPVFAAHFPGNPVLPGVCQVRLVTELIRQVYKKPYVLRTAKSIKYSGLITPSLSVVNIHITAIECREDVLDCKAAFADADGNVLSKMTLTYTL